MLGWTFDTIIIKLMVRCPYTEHLNDRAGILALALSSRRILAGEGTSVCQRMTTNAFPGSFVP